MPPRPGPSSGRPPPLPLEPEVLVSVAVVDAVHHYGHAFDPRMPAGRLSWVKDDRAGHVLDQFALDLPDDFLALLGIGLHRLLVDELVDVRVAVPGIIALCPADIILVELLVGIVDAGL